MRAASSPTASSWWLGDCACRRRRRPGSRSRRPPGGARQGRPGRGRAGSCRRRRSARRPRPRVRRAARAVRSRGRRCGGGSGRRCAGRRGSLGDDEESALSLAFQEGVGGDGGPHADGVDPRALGALPPAEEFTDTRHRRVGVPRPGRTASSGREQAAVRASRDDVGEGAASVDPELPACHVCSPLPPSSERPEAADHVAQNTLVRQLGRGWDASDDHSLGHEVPYEDPDHSDGQVELGGELGDRLGVSRQSSTMSTCSGDSEWSASGSSAWGSVTTTAIRSRRCWAGLVVRPRVMA